MPGWSAETQEEANIFKVNLERRYGSINLVKLVMHVMLPAAVMTAKTIGEQIESGNVPKRFTAFGTTVEKIFCDLPDLQALHGTRANGFSTGAIGVFAYLNKTAFGLKHFAALNRKFDIGLMDKSDLIPLTSNARDLIADRWLTPLQ